MVDKLLPPMQTLDNPQRVNSPLHQDHRETVGMCSLTMGVVSTTFGITTVEDQTKAWTATFVVVFGAMELGPIY
jgi:hypothetical protein